MTGKKKLPSGNRSWQQQSSVIYHGPNLEVSLSLDHSKGRTRFDLKGAWGHLHGVRQVSFMGCLKFSRREFILEMDSPNVGVSHGR